MTEEIKVMFVEKKDRFNYVMQNLETKEAKEMSTSPNLETAIELNKIYFAKTNDKWINELRLAQEDQKEEKSSEKASEPTQNIKKSPWDEKNENILAQVSGKIAAELVVDYSDWEKTTKKVYKFFKEKKYDE